MSEAALFDGQRVTVHTWRPDAAGDSATRTPQRLDPARLSDAVHDPGVVLWVDVVDPAPADLRRLAAVIGLSTYSVEDVLAPNERAKASRHGSDQRFFVTYAVGSQGGRMSRVAGFVLPTALLTFRQDDTPDLAEVLRRLDDDSDLRVDSDALAYTLLDVIVDGYSDALDVLEDRMESLEDVLFAERSTDRAFVKEVFELRKQLVALHRVAAPTRDLVVGLLGHHHHSGRQGASPEEFAERYDDLHDHITRVAETSESLRDAVAVVFDTNLSLQDSRLNVVMRRLAGWAAVLAVPTAISGWFGQNVPYPGFGNRAGMWTASVLTLVCTLGVYGLLRRKEWL